MKKNSYSLLIVSIFLIASCGGQNDSTRSEFDRSSEKMSGLEKANHRANVSREFRALLREQGFDKNEAILEADRVTYQASVTYSRAFKNHPELAAYRERIEGLETEKYQADLDNDTRAFENAVAGLKQAEAELKEAGEKLADLKAMHEVSKEALHEANRLKASLRSRKQGLFMVLAVTGPALLWELTGWV